MAETEFNRRETELAPERSAERPESASLEQEAATLRRAAESDVESFDSGTDRITERLAAAGPETAGVLKGLNEEADRLLANLRERAAAVAANATVRPEAPTLSPTELETMSPSELYAPKFDKAAQTLMPDGPTLAPERPTMASPAESVDLPTVPKGDTGDVGRLMENLTAMSHAEQASEHDTSSASYADTVAVDPNIEAQALSQRFMSQHELPKDSGDANRLAAELGISDDIVPSSSAEITRNWLPENSPEEIEEAKEPLSDQELDARREQAASIRELLMGPMKGNKELEDQLKKLYEEISAARTRFVGNGTETTGTSATMRVETPPTGIDRVANVTVIESDPDGKKE